MRVVKRYGLQGVLGIIFLALLLWLGLTPRNAWPLILLLYTAAFGIYLLAAHRKGSSLQLWIGVAVIARVMMLFLFPNLSDDIYRFIWDGQLWLHGLNPYQIPPREVIAANIDPATFSASLYAQLNSPDYYTVYPLFPQVTFAIGAWLGGNDWYWQALTMKCVLLIVELLTLRYMFRQLRDDGRSRQILIYALNPLVIIELVGNVHFEALMILGLVAAYHYLRRNRLIAAGGAMTLAIGAKLLPLLALPLLIRRMPRRRLIGLGLLVFLGCLIVILPIMGGGAGFADSIGLYFRDFEFNASIYYVVRYIGYLSRGYNTIAATGPWLAATALTCIGAYILLERKPVIANWPVAILVVLGIYLAFATTVHPWYICPLVAMSVFSTCRFPMVWSGVVFLSYATYRTDAYAENLWLVAIEYIAVGVAVIVDVLDTKRRSSTAQSSKT